MAETTTTSSTPGRRLLPSTAGEFNSRLGRWTPAMTPKMIWTIETINQETGEQRMVGKPLLDANGQAVFEPNPAAARMIKQNYGDLGYMPTVEFPEPKQERRVEELEETVRRLEAILLGTVKPSDVIAKAPPPKPATREELLALAQKEADQKVRAQSPSVSSGIADSASRTHAVGSEHTV